MADATTAEEETVEEPADKKRKIDESEYVESEKDAPEDKRSKLDAGCVAFHPDGLTLNALPTLGGQMLTSLSGGGFQYLLAGARANVGLKAGRYMFQIAIVESRDPAQGSVGANAQIPKPRQLVRVGFATAGSSLYLDGADSVTFDTEGIFASSAGKKIEKTRQFGQGSTVAVLLNLDPASKNNNTVSLFVDGVRSTPPQPLPDALKGKTLFPAVAYRNSTLSVCFTSLLMNPLPFSCSGVQDAAKADCEILKPASTGKPEVVFTAGLPDGGVFDYVDKFLQQNSSYSEVSDRTISQWAVKSGMKKVGGRYGIELMDDMSVSVILGSVLPVMQRNLIVVDMQASLQAQARQLYSARYPAGDFNRVCHVVMGEPPADVKKKTHEALLKVKQEEHAKKKATEEKRKEAEVKKKKLAQEAKRKREEAMAKKKGEEVEQKEDEPEEEAKEVEEEVKIVELTEEEKKQWFCKRDPDVTEDELGEILAGDCSLPAKADGFNEVKFVWQSEAVCKGYLASWVEKQKSQQRFPTLEPGEWFWGQFDKWKSTLTRWKDYQAIAKERLKKKADEKRAAEMKKKAAEARKIAQEKLKALDVRHVSPSAKKEGGEAKEDADTTEDKDEEEEKEEETAMEIDAEDLDVWAVENVDDIGNGEPLYSKFGSEDWRMLKLRFELHLMAHAFPKDSGRPCFNSNLTQLYYSRYYRKQLLFKDYGCDDMTAMVKLLDDTIGINADTSTVETWLPIDTPLHNFIRLTEDERRDRLKRIDAGDESAQLKLRIHQPPGPPPKAPGPPWAPKAPGPPPQGRPTAKGNISPAHYSARPTSNNARGQRHGPPLAPSLGAGPARHHAPPPPPAPGGPPGCFSAKGGGKGALPRPGPSQGAYGGAARGAYGAYA